MASLTFVKINLKGEPIGKSITVEYAPTEMTFSKATQYADIAVPGLEQPIIQFVRGDAETLSLELFFDSTKDGTSGKAVAVTGQVEKFRQMIGIRGSLHSPPLVRVFWGDDFPGTAMGEMEKAGENFTAVVTSISRNFTLFSPDGKPLRARVSLALKHYATVSEQINAINYQSSDHTRIHTISEGETLPLIAHDAYEDPQKWRVIADANNLKDIRALTPGETLILPPLM